MLSRAPEGVLALVAPTMTWRGELSPELPAAARQADLVWDVVFADGSPGVLHIELQTKADAAIGRRLAEYSLRLHVRDDRPVYSIVIFLRPVVSLPQSPYVMACMGEPRHTFVFDSIRLWELQPELVLGTNYYTLWPLAALMADVTVESTVALAQRIAQTPLPRHERSELTGLLTLLAGMRLPRQAILEAVTYRTG